jgi:diadenosine tetraphosphate (Ap4A) HIT family hydrolase
MHSPFWIRSLFRQLIPWSLAAIFALPPVEYAACFELVQELRELLVQKWKTKSLSVVVNCGAEANQTTQYAHIHLAPWHRDVPLPPAADVWSSLK